MNHISAEARQAFMRSSRADHALYKAKASGKNRLFVHGDDAHTQNARSRVA